jgi:hypothetical protein
LPTEKLVSPSKRQYLNREMISWPVDDLGVLNLSTGVKRKVTTPVGGLGNWGASGDFAVLWRNPEQWKIHSSVRRFPQIIGALCINPQGHDWLLKVNPVWRFQVGMKGTIFFLQLDVLKTWTSETLSDDPIFVTMVSKSQQQCLLGLNHWAWPVLCILPLLGVMIPDGFRHIFQWAQCSRFLDPSDIHHFRLNKSWQVESVFSPVNAVNGEAWTTFYRPHKSRCNSRQ